ncbi:hypothetical protein [Sodalis sp. C49]|uniref:hypothetical protein n=1 Tax=unclassified Sodalis (in: enterobacteria) TaxID=2636512 RepID=UPI003965B304
MNEIAKIGPPHSVIPVMHDDAVESLSFLASKAAATAVDATQARNELDKPFTKDISAEAMLRRNALSSDFQLTMNWVSSLVNKGVNVVRSVLSGQ